MAAMAAHDRQQDRLQIPLMFAFRDAFKMKDAAKQEDVRVDGERVISERSSIRRRGAEEALLKADLALDLSHLVDTIDLESSVDLDGFDYVRKSVLNFGLYDLNHLIMAGDTASEVMDYLKRAMLQHEPRLSPDTMVFSKGQVDDEVNQRVRFQVHADLICKPLDIPIEFLAEVDTASGKILVSRPTGSA
jgi:type VI secretion system protein ImpF